MKKVICLTAVILLMAFVACGCSEKDTKSGNGEKSGQETIAVSDTQKGTVDLSSYKKPADSVSIDLTKADPSNDKMRFVYDAEGKVTQCYYNIGEQQVYVSYSYKNGTAQIYAFMGGVVVADETIKLSAFDAEKGFAAIDGYYFKGFSAE